MNDNFSNKMDEETQKAGKKVGKKAGKKVAKVGKKVMKAITTAILTSIKLLLPFIIVPLSILLIVIFSYFLIFEFTGTEKEYTKEYENEIEKSEDGIYYATQVGISGENKLIRDYYEYMSGQSYFQSVGKDEEIYGPDDDEVKDVFDYYSREDEFNLAPNLLFSLDEHLYNWTYKYSEQFIKAVNYNKEAFTLLPLIDEDGAVIVESEEEDIETGEKTGDMIDSIRDYGLASILKYNEEEDYERIETIQGKNIAKDVWDSESGKVVKEYLATPEEFEIETDRELIYLIDKAILFTGNIKYEYENKEENIGNLRAGVGEDEKSKTMEYIYGTHEEEIYETREVKNEETGEMEEEEVLVDVIEHNLKMYRSSDSAIFEEVPHVSNTIADDEGLDYFNSYLENFETYVPVDVIEGFDFDKRIDYDSHVFDYDGILIDDYGLDIGSRSDEEKANRAKQYMPVIEEYSDNFGINPYVLLAMMTQESGGNPNPSNGYGIMQIYNGDRSLTAPNKYGERETVSITRAEKSNVDKSVRFAAAYYRNLLDMYDGDDYKAIQSYNLGEGTMRAVKRANPAAWESNHGWLLYRETGRQQTFPGTKSASYGCMAFPAGTVSSNSTAGDSCYLENVLQWYSGDVGGGNGKDVDTDEDFEESEKIEDKIENEEDKEEKENAWDKIVEAGKSLGSKFMDFVVIREEDELIPKTEYKNNLPESRIEDVLGTTKALNEDMLFSEAVSGETTDMHFWEEGYMDAASSQGMSLQDILDIAPNKDGYLPPIDMTGLVITSPFGIRYHPIHFEYKMHNGVDIGCAIGTKMYAIADGVVSFAGAAGTAGNMLKIDHGNGISTVYMHLNAFASMQGGGVIKQGDSISQGDHVAFAGDTGASKGAHLHFEFRINDVPHDPTGIVLGK